MQDTAHPARRESVPGRWHRDPRVGSGRGLSEGNFDLIRAQLQAGRSESGRYLRDPAIRRLPANRCLIFLQDQVPVPILARKVKYFEERCWRGRWDLWRAGGAIMPFRPPSPSPAGPSTADRGGLASKPAGSTYARVETQRSQHETIAARHREAR